tara:strand:+ start:244 stop:1542 length:1299 start_codon:yes stop_codon:yes gene_type:complete
VVFGTTILGSNPSAPANNMFLIKKIKKLLFPFYRDKNIKEIFKILNSDKNHNVRLVGGCVRNYLNDEKIGDIDLATIFTPGQVIKKFTNTNFKIIKTGLDHGTITLNSGGKNFEITTLREDINTDGRHAEVSFSNDWEKDSQRRDFTINAIYMDQNGKIFDPQNGLKDLKEKKIRFIGKTLNRIQEDYLRILRFLRFSIQYKDFQKDEQTFNIIKKNLTGITKISKERIFSELSKIIELENIKYIYNNKDFYEIFKIIFPEFRYFERIKNMDENIYQKYLKNEKKLILALFLIDNSDNHIYFGHKYKISNHLKEYLDFFHLNFTQLKKNKIFIGKELKKNVFYNGKNKIISLAIFDFLTNSRKNSENLKKLINKINSTNIPTFPITAKYLLQNGFKSGRQIGEVLKKIEKQWIKNDFNLDNEQLNNLIKKEI